MLFDMTFVALCRNRSAQLLWPMHEHQPQTAYFAWDTTHQMSPAMQREATRVNDLYSKPVYACNSKSNTHAVVLGAPLARNICGYEQRFFLKISVSVCQIVPSKIHQDHHLILSYANGRGNLFILREAELRQSSSSENHILINALNSS